MKLKSRSHPICDEHSGPQPGIICVYCEADHLRRRLADYEQWETEIMRRYGDLCPASPAAAAKVTDPTDKPAKWICDVCLKPSRRMVSKGDWTHYRHTQCENTIQAPVPKFSLRGKDGHQK